MSISYVIEWDKKHSTSSGVVLAEFGDYYMGIAEVSREHFPDKADIEEDNPQSIVKIMFEFD
jgi:hypothetical protein